MDAADVIKETQKVFRAAKQNAIVLGQSDGRIQEIRPQTESSSTKAGSARMR
jgi:hypothetical protein